jgi:GNAT superfamily N-acetyltransferase
VSLSIRPYQARDEAAVYDICVRTGDDGQDATGRFDDVQLLADIWAGPYLFLEPDLAFVLDDGERPVGYVLGTADTAAFVESYRKSWLPRFSETLPARTIAAGPEEEQLLSVLRHPERMLCPELTGYPAHLHIDILPAHQGGGNGRRLIESFVQAVARAGAVGLHVAVSPTNTRAHGFSLRVGVVRLHITGCGGAFFYGLKTPAA